MSKNTRRGFLAISILLALIFIAGVVYTRCWLDPWLKAKLIQTVADKGEGLYSLEIDRLHVNVFTGSAMLDGIRLNTDSLLWGNRRKEKPEANWSNIRLNIQKLQVRQVNLWRFWRSKELSLKELYLLDPDLSMNAVQDSVPVAKLSRDSLKRNIFEGLPKLLSPLAKSLNLERLQVDNGKIYYRQTRSNVSGEQAADSVQLVLSGLHFAQGDTSSGGRLLYSDQLRFQARNFNWYPAKGVYGYHAKSIKLDSDGGQFKLEDLAILPTISDQAFMQRLNVRKVRIRLNAAQVQVQDLDLFRALHKMEWSMRSVTLDHAKFNIYQNKNLPLDLQKKMPNEIFRGMENYFHIDTITVRHSNILYKEVIEDEKGLLEFNNANGIILNVSNDSLKMTDSTPLRAYARAELMGAGLLDMTLELPLLSPTLRGNFQASLGKTDMVYLNRLLEEKNHLRIDSGLAEEITVQANIYNGVAKGELKAVYNDLKISLLRENSKKKKIISIVANLLLRGENEPGQKGRPFKTGKIEYEREPGDGILRFMWRSIKEGLMQTLVPGGIELGKSKD